MVSGMVLPRLMLLTWQQEVHLIASEERDSLKIRQLTAHPYSTNELAFPRI
jgi:hypothetical protein